jgi:hypothetical protein
MSLWLVARQALLTVGSVGVGLVVCGTGGALAGHRIAWLTPVGVMVGVVGFFAAVAVWSIGPDDLEVGTLWTLPMAVALFLMLGAVFVGLPGAYMTHRGERTGAVVTAKVPGPTLGATDQRIRVRIGMTGEDPGLLHYHDGRDLQGGDRVDVLVDPHGWFAAHSGQSDPRLRRTAQTAGWTGLAGVALLTVLRAGRDVRRSRSGGNRGRRSSGDMLSW